MLPYGLTILFGLFVALRIFPLAALNGTISLTDAVHGDTAQHIVGQRYFLADRWRWPPLSTGLIEPPEGVNIALTDSVPLMALLGKPWFGLLPSGGHFVYLWVFISYVLQPAAAVFALRSAGERRLVPALAAGVIAISLPAFIFRFNHAALCGHFLILAAIGVYFRAVRQPDGRLWRNAAWFTVIPVLSLLVHPYFLAMTTGILLAVPAALILRLQFRPALWAILELAGAGVVVGASAWAGGYLGADVASGFGLYSLNLLSPFLPTGSAFFAFPMIDVTGGQYEGFSYLGLGLAALAALAALTIIRKATLRDLQQHGALLLVALGAVVFAASDKVYVGTHLIAHDGLIPAVLKQFRASGRFVWVDLYVLLIGATLVLCRCLRPAWLYGVLAACALLQFADAGSLRRQVRGQIRAAQAWTVDASVMRPILARHQSLTLWPTYACDHSQVNNPPYSDMLLLASERALPVNTIPVARNTADDACRTDAITQPVLRPGELRVLLPGTGANLVTLLPDWRRECHHLPAGLVGCSDDPAMTSLPAVEVAPVPFGEAVSLGSAQGQALKGPGWEIGGQAGAWTIGPVAMLIETTAKTSRPLRLRMVGHGIAPRDSTQKVTVTANGTLIATWSVETDRPLTYQADLPAGQDVSGVLDITLHIANPTRPRDITITDDTRPLGFYLESFSLEEF